MSGYKYCDCRDCFELTCGAEFCHGCEEAGCEPDSECEAEDAYGCAEELDALASSMGLAKVGEGLYE
jgi:hypothetical protein